MSFIVKRTFLSLALLTQCTFASASNSEFDAWDCSQEPPCKMAPQRVGVSNLMVLPNEILAHTFSALDVVDFASALTALFPDDRGTNIASAYGQHKDYYLGNLSRSHSKHYVNNASNLIDHYATVMPFLHRLDGLGVFLGDQPLAMWLERDPSAVSRELEDMDFLLTFLDAIKVPKLPELLAALQSHGGGQDLKHIVESLGREFFSYEDLGRYRWQQVFSRISFADLGTQTSEERAQSICSTLYLTTANRAISLPHFSEDPTLSSESSIMDLSSDEEDPFSFFEISPEQMGTMSDCWGA